jgi:membrane fusion protein, copper/silver efflux system
MTHENTPTPPSRRFGVAALVAAALASAALAAGTSFFLLSRRDAGGHDHAHEGGTAAAKAQWQCPMHPSIVQDHPGDCPICGMKLVQVAGPAQPAAGSAGTGAAADAKEQWQCPMHPSIVQDHPGDCPICGMKLVQVAGASGGAPAGGAAPEGLSAVTIDSNRQQLIGLKVAHAEQGAVGGTWRTNGRVAVDETRIHHVNVKFSGFMEHVHGDFVGRLVKKGEPLFSIYSPDLLVAQEEYLLALRTRKTLGGNGSLAGDGEKLVQAARRKLELWDVPRSEIERLERTGEPSRTITFYSPATGVLTKKDVVPGMRVNAGDMPFEIIDLSHVWVLADAYESDLGHVKPGMAATLTLKAFPNRTFSGRVAFVDPLLDPKTRTAKVRIDFPNATGELRPEMFGEVVLQGRSREGLRIPSDAVIDSGTKIVVFVSLGDGKFAPREVTLGERNPDFVEIASGLEKGDGVVTRANFLIDSESRLRASLAALSAEPPARVDAAGTGGAPAGGGTAGGDPHAGHGGR